MVADYIRKNFYWCIFWGFVLQCVGGSVTAMSHSLPVILLGWLIYLAGTAVLIFGFSFYMRAKGRSPAWSVLALLSLVGWVALILLKDTTLPALNQGEPEAMR